MSTPHLNDLLWIVGRWTCQVWGGVFEETWSPASGGTMLGHGKLVKDQNTAFEEHMTVREADGGVVMWIHAGRLGETPTASTPFTLTHASADRATFENPTHDFPRTITYTLLAADRIDCLIEGTQNAKPTQILFAFHRQR